MIAEICGREKFFFLLFWYTKVDSHYINPGLFGDFEPFIVVVGRNILIFPPSPPRNPSKPSRKPMNFCRVDSERTSGQQKSAICVCSFRIWIGKKRRWERLTEAMKKNSETSEIQKDIVREARSPTGRKKGLDRLLLSLTIVFFLCAVVFFLFEPFRRNVRSNRVSENVRAIDRAMESELPDVTVIVPKDDLFARVDGEAIENINGSEYDIEGVFSELPDDVVLTALGTIRIPSVEMNIPLWNDAGVIPLRYGAGMLAGTAMPGQEGNFVVLGHNMRARGSLFNRLHEVKVFDEVLITTMDKQVYTYIIDEIITPLDPANLPEYIDIDDGEGKQITLITCTLQGGTHRFLAIGHLKET